MSEKDTPGCKARNTEIATLLEVLLVMMPKDMVAVRATLLEAARRLRGAPELSAPADADTPNDNDNRSALLERN